MSLTQLLNKIRGRKEESDSSPKPSPGKAKSSTGTGAKAQVKKGTSSDKARAKAARPSTEVNSQASSSNKKDATQAKTPDKNTPEAEKSPTPGTSDQDKMQARFEARTISRLESLPKFARIASRPEGLVDIGAELRKDYILLLVSEDQKMINIIRSTDSYRSKGVDQNFLAIRSELTKKGYKFGESYFASKPLIKLIYDKADKGDHGKKFIENASDLAKDFEALLEESVLDGVSDIHIEVRRDDAVVRTRINGKLQFKYEWDVQYARDLAVVVYQVMAEEKDVVFIPTQPQDAVIDRILPIGRVRVRLATSPAYPDGFDMVMRLLPMGIATDIKKLSTLGYMPDQVEVIDKMNDRPVGAIIISGVTGSGKSTSMATMLATKIQENNGQIKVITVENPPENQIPGATQVPVVLSREGRSGKSPFSAAIKSAMRSDPDILMVGEVRDEDTADLLVHATQSGHQTMTTLHAPSAFAIPSRLRSLGVDNDVLGSGDFLAGMIYQTLVPTVCQSCGIPFSDYKNMDLTKRKLATVQRIEEFASDQEKSAIKFKNSDGCSECDGGITGRTVVAEAVFPDDKMKALFSETKDSEAKEYFIKSGQKTVLHAGLDKLFQGLIDANDLEHKVGRLNEILLYRKIENK